MKNNKVLRLLKLIYPLYALFSIWFCVTLFGLLFFFLANVMFGCQNYVNNVCTGGDSQVITFERNTLYFSFFTVGFIVFLYKYFLKSRKEWLKILFLLSSIITVPFLLSFLFDFLQYLWSL